MKNVNSDIAYEFIRKRILNRTFPPGHPLMTGIFRPRSGKGRAPVRDALRQLETDSLVVIHESTMRRASSIGRQKIPGDVRASDSDEVYALISR